MTAGADPKFTGSGGDTALMAAAWQRDLRMVRELPDRGVSVNATDVHGETALMSASQTCLDGKIVQLLLNAGADPNVKSTDGFTALMSAAGAGNEIAAEKLLKAGADPTAKNKYGKTAQDEACGRGEKGHARVCALVQEALRPVLGEGAEWASGIGEAKLAYDAVTFFGGVAGCHSELFNRGRDETWRCAVVGATPNPDRWASRDGRPVLVDEPRVGTHGAGWGS